MQQMMRDTGIAAVGDVPAGTHFCLFYESSEDLAELLVPYLKTGLDNNELCLWVTSQPLSVQAAKNLLQESVGNLDELIGCGQVEVIDPSQWYTTSGQFDGLQIIERWFDKEEEALRQGFDGLRFAGDTSWIDRADWQKFMDYEAAVDDIIEQHQIVGVCAWSLQQRGIRELIDVASNHQFAVVRSGGDWWQIESQKRNHLAQELQKRSEQLLVCDRAMEATTEGINIVDARQPGHPVIYVNRGFEILTGYKASELLGQNMRLLQGPDTDADAIGKMREMIQAERECCVEVLNYRKDGSPFWNRVSITPVRDESGQVTHFIGVHADVTRRCETEVALREGHRHLQATLQELEAAQTQLVQQERFLALGQMASEIAHDLNNTLSPILGYADLLLSDRRLPNDTRESLQAIATAARDAATVIARLRESYPVSDTSAGMSQDVPKRGCDPFFATETVDLSCEEPDNALPAARILYIDDDPCVRRVVAEMLTQLGQKVDVAKSGVEGLQKAQADNHDLVITDFGMPELDGVTLTRHIKRDQPQMPVIILTGWGESVLPHDLPAGEAPDHVLAKPITMSLLRDVLVKVL